jgi:hypothetical protein
MSGQTFPDELPEIVAGHYDPPLLHDSEPAPLSSLQQQQARQAVEQVVRELNRLLNLS